MDNDKFTYELILVFENWQINEDFSIDVGGHLIKDGELVIDERIYFTYKKGHPEIRP